MLLLLYLERHITVYGAIAPIEMRIRTYNWTMMERGSILSDMSSREEVPGNPSTSSIHRNLTRKEDGGTWRRLYGWRWNANLGTRYTSLRTRWRDLSFQKLLEWLTVRSEYNNALISAFDTDDRFWTHGAPIATSTKNNEGAHRQLQRHIASSSTLAYVRKRHYMGRSHYYYLSS